MGEAIKQQAIAAVHSSLVRQVRMHDGVSRIDLSRRMGLAPSTVGLYVEQLIDEGFLREGPKIEQPAPGRPPTVVQLDPRAGQFIGVDFEARQILATAVDFSQNPLGKAKQAIRSTDSVRQVTRKIQETITELAAGKRTLLGIGVGVPGSVDAGAGVARHYEHIRGWDNVPLVQLLTDRFKVPVYMENNIRVMALAEQWFGEGRKMRNFLTIGIRSGVGAGVIVDGELRRGHSNLAGEIGNWPIHDESQIAHDQVKGEQDSGDAITLEQRVSVKAILEQATEQALNDSACDLPLTRGSVTLKTFLQQANAGHPFVLEILQKAGAHLGRTIAQASLLLDSEAVFLAGPMAAFGELFLDPVRESAARWTPSSGRVPEIVLSKLGDHAGSLGAAALAVHQWQPER